MMAGAERCEQNRQLSYLAVAMVLAMTTWFAAAAVLAQLRVEFQLSRTEGSWLTIAVQLGFVAGALASAVFNVADLVPPRRLVLIGSTLAAVANLSLLVAPDYTTALAGRAITGAGLALVYPPALKATATWFRDRRGFALGVMVGALTLGSALPHLVTALGGFSWQSTIIVTSVATVAGGLIAEYLATDGPYPFGRASFETRRVLVVFRNRELRLATLGYFGHMWELYAMWSWFGVFYRDLLAGQGNQDPARLAALATFAVIGAGAAGSWLGGVVSDRFGRETAASSAMALSGSVALFIGFLSDAPPAVVLGLGVFWGFWVVADSAQFSTIVSETADDESVGTALTTQLAAGFVLTIFTIFLVPVIEGAHGWGWAFLVLAPGPAVGTYAMARLWRIRRPESPARPETAEVFVSPFF
jgi:MFS family permease